MGRGPPSIRRRLLALVFVCILPGACLVAVLLISEYRQERDRLEHSTRSTAHAIASALDQRLAVTQAALNVLATSRLIHRDDLAEFHRQAREVQLQQGLAIVGLIDSNLQPVMNTAQPPGAPLQPAGSAAHLGDLFSARRAVVTDLFRGSIHGTPTFAVAVPVLRDGRADFALVGGISPGTIHALLLAQNLPAGWIAAVVDRTGTIVARNVDHAQFLGKQVRETLRAQMQAEPEGTVDGVTLDGVPVLTTFSRVPTWGWRVIIAIPRDQLTLDLRESLLAVAAGTLLVLAISILFATLLGGRISRTVRSLRGQAERLGRSEPLEPIHASFLEAGELAASMQKASAELQQAGTDLTARQHELAQSNERLSGLVESAMDGIISVDDRQTIVLFNQAAEAMFGWDRSQVIGRNLEMLVPGRFHEMHRQHIKSFGTSGATTRRMGALAVVHGVRSDGSEFPLEAAISQVSTPSGRVFTVVVRDVTDMLKARQERHAFASRLSATREQDKKRMARELHDDIAQTLAVLKLDGNWLMAQGDVSEAARSKLARMNTLLTDGIVAVRRIAQDLRPLVLDELGFRGALEVLADSFSERTGVVCTLECAPGLELEDPHATELYRLVQEALSNVNKHARATQVLVRVDRSQDALLLVVQDNGAGFDTEAPRKPGSLGLAGIRERVQLLRGVMEISSNPGRGTRLEVKLRFDTQDAELRYV